MPILIPEALTAVAVVALVVGVLALVLGIVALRRAGQLRAHYTALMTGVDGRDLATALETYVSRVTTAEARVGRLDHHADDLDDRLRHAVQRVRLLRYRAFEDGGGDQSFSLVLLDGEDNGVVLSGLYGRGGAHVYAKPLLGGRSTYALTTEEQRVVAEALGGPEAG
jgi:hypothetical protein